MTQTTKSLAMFILSIGFLISPILALADLDHANRLIIVEIENRKLKFYENGEIKKEFSVRVGKKETPTPVGEGYIFEKRERAIFRYHDPPNKGKIIRWSQLSNGQNVLIDYGKIKALGFRINNCDSDKYSIHSVTDPETIGKAISGGCVGINIEDMLELFPLVELGTKIVIKP
ncbi:MAG: L,D-transpeptidase [Patescibacteria group bacterium]